MLATKHTHGKCNYIPSGMMRYQPNQDSYLMDSFYGFTDKNLALPKSALCRYELRSNAMTIWSEPDVCMANYSETSVGKIYKNTIDLINLLAVELSKEATTLSCI